MQLDNPYVPLLFLAGVLSLVLGYFAWRRRGAPGASALVALTIATALWQFGYAMELASAAESTMLFWAKVEYPAIVAVPIAWLAVTLQYTGRRILVTTRNVVALSVLPTGIVLLAWTNESHGLIWSSVGVESSETLSVLSLEHGAAFWVHTGYSYLLVLAGIVVLSVALARSLRVYWKQGAALLVSVLSPLIANITYTTSFRLDPPVDPTPLSFILSVGVLALALYRTQLFEIAPVARKAVFETMEIGVLVLDHLDRIADCNKTAQKIMGIPAVRVIGSPIGEVWPAWRDISGTIDDKTVDHIDHEFSVDETLRNFEVAISSVDDTRGRHSGRLILFHDITERKEAESALRHLQQQLERAQDEERRNIARELHDEIGQDLTGLRYFLDSIDDVSDEGAATLAKSNALLEGLLRKVRDLSLTLSPPMIDDLGLVAALDWLTRRYTAQTGITVNFVHDGVTDRFSPEIEMAAYRTAQEGLTNVARHAEADEATLTLDAHGGLLEIRVHDSGVGFDLENGVDLEDLGLRGIRERLEAIGGKLVVDTAPGQGTRLNAQVPLVPAG